MKKHLLCLLFFLVVAPSMHSQSSFIKKIGDLPVIRQYQRTNWNGEIVDVKVTITELAVNATGIMLGLKKHEGSKNAGTYLYLSEDEGATWKDITANVPKSGFFNAPVLVEIFAIDESFFAIQELMTSGAGDGTRLFHSDDNGKTWKTLIDDVPYISGSMYCTSPDRNIVYLEDDKVSTSSDLGKNWNQIPFPKNPDFFPEGGKAVPGSYVNPKFWRRDGQSSLKKMDIWKQENNILLGHPHGYHIVQHQYGRDIIFGFAVPHDGYFKPKGRICP